MHTWWRTYLFIWSGQFVSMLSSTAVQFAIIIWLSLEYQSAEVLAYAGISGLLPHALIGSFIGVFIDRWDRKLVMIFADSFIAFCTLLMTFILTESESHLFIIYLLLGCRSIGTAFHAPATQAIVPLIVPHDQLLRVAGINQILQSISSIAGPAIGTLAIVTLPINKVLYLDILGASVAVISLFFVSIPTVRQRKAKKNTSIKTAISDFVIGLQSIYHNKGLSYLFAMVMISNIFIVPVTILFPLLIMNYYGGGKWEIGFVEVVFGVGMLVGGLVIGGFRVKLSKIAIINWMDIILGICFILAGLFPPSWFGGFVAVMWFGGITFSVFTATFNAILQQIIPPNKLGRVFAIYLSLANVPSILGLLSTGIIAHSIGVIWAIVLAGIFTLIIGILSFFIPSMMSIEKKYNTEFS